MRSKTEVIPKNKKYEKIYSQDFAHLANKFEGFRGLEVWVGVEGYLFARWAKSCK